MTDRPELGALLDRLLRTVIDRELPIIERHGVDMWGYGILSVLARGPAATQAELAAATGRDKTRLIGNLDRLAADGLVERTADPADRRNKIVSLTAAGARLQRACAQEIRAMEQELLADVGAPDRAAFERVLAEVAMTVGTDRHGRSE